MSTIPTANTLVWVSIADLAREYSKSVQTMHNWAKSGFLHELGYRTRQDETGHWFVAKAVAKTNG